jgi:GDP-4-dehydro-6-deoxy-D-mannose reductase
MSQNIWITGVAGFTGKHLVNYIRKLNKKDRIIGLDINEKGSSDVDRYYSLDLNNMEALNEVAIEEPPDCVFHLAAAMPPAPEKEMWHVNIGGTINLLQAIALIRPSGVRFLGIGSAGEYSPKKNGKMFESSPCRGTTINGRVKRAQTILTLALGRELSLDTKIVRPFNLIGPGLSRNFVAGSLCEQFVSKNNNKIKMGNINSERDFIDIRDAVAAYWAVMEKGKKGNIYNVCTGKYTSIKELIEIYQKLVAGKADIEIDKEKFRNVDFDRVYGDTTKIVKDTHWKPKISLRKSLKDMLNYMGH